MEKNIEMVQILNQEVSNKFKVRIKYALFECTDPNCGRTWGINLIDDQLRPDQLLCQECAVRKISEDL